MSKESQETWRSPNFNKAINNSGTFGRSKSSMRMIPKLPLDSLLEESSLNLSAIEHTGKEIFEECKGNTLQLSPVVSQRKTFSRLDESSVVDPLSHVLVDSIAKRSSNQDSIKGILQKQAQKYDKALLVLQANFHTYKEHTDKEISILRKEIADIKALRIADMHTFKDKVLGSIKHELAQFKQELKMKDSQATTDRASAIRKSCEREMEDKARCAIQTRKPTAKGKSQRIYQQLVVENQRLKEQIQQFWRDFGINK